MITKFNNDNSITLWDGKKEHNIKHSDFALMKSHGKGGIHPGISEDYEAYFALNDSMDIASCPITPIDVTIKDAITGESRIIKMVPINCYLQAKYGPDNNIVTVPINGDAAAQRLHWLKRNKKEQDEMKAFLEWLGAWRLE